MGKAIKIISDILFIVGLVIAGIFLVGHFVGIKPFNIYIVSSGSMEPAVKTGSIVFVAPKAGYGVGDIVTYKSGPKITTTHRIVAQDGDKFKLAGDANNSPDPGLVDAEKVIGTVRFTIPFVGYIAAFAKTPKGFILLVIVPATIIIYEEIKNIIKQIKFPSPKLGEGLREGYLSKDRGEVLKPAVIIPIIFALLIPLTLSISYFIDRETSSGNQFTGYVPSPTPTIPVTPSPTP